MIAAALFRQPDEFIGDRHALGIGEPRPIAPDEIGVPRRHEIIAVIVKDKEIAILPIEHRGQDLRHRQLGRLIIGGGAAIDIDERGPRHGEIILELFALGMDELAFQRGNLAIGQMARLQRGKDGNHHRRRDKGQGGGQKQFLPVILPKPVGQASHRRIVTRNSERFPEVPTRMRVICLKIRQVLDL